MQANAVTITKFYTAFAQLDGDGMEACYVDGVAFEDEVFTLHGKAQTMGMRRMVLNRINARFTFDTLGLIATHRDRFNFWSWSSQALGAPGLMLGWSPFLRGKVRQQAAGNLQKFMAGRKPS
nr:nuclear transport factor 2 family protein [Rhodoferax sp.]